MPDEDGRRAAAAARRGFVAMLAHELRGPLTVALGQAELLATASAAFDEPTRTAMASDILGSVERFAQLLEDVCLVTEAEAGTLMLALEDVDVGSVLSLVAPWQPGLGTGLHVHADPQLLERALHELVANARVAVAEGDPELSAGAHDGRVDVGVRDHGEPIPPVDHAAALDRLLRDPSRQGTTRRRSGIGVTVARALAEAMGGEVRIDDPPDARGCIFTLSLPAKAT